MYYDKEIPYSVEVVVEQFKEDEKSIHINAVIYVERDSQKGIIIGRQGKALKKVATEARKTLEHFFRKSIYLETFVKVDKDWRSSDKELKILVINWINIGCEAVNEDNYGKFSCDCGTSQCGKVDTV